MATSLPPPGYVRAIGGLAVVLGLIFTAAVASDWSYWIPAGLLTAVGGVGLIAGVRWAWPAILVLGAFVFIVGIGFLMVDPPEHPAFPNWIGCVLIPLGFAVVASAFTPSTWRWLRGRTITRA